MIYNVQPAVHKSYRGLFSFRILLNTAIEKYPAAPIALFAGICYN